MISRLFPRDVVYAVDARVRLLAGIARCRTFAKLPWAINGLDMFYLVASR